MKSLSTMRQNSSIFSSGSLKSKESGSKRRSSIRTLERIFIENQIYKKIETVKTLEGIHETLEASFKPFRKKLLRDPTHDDREKLLQIPIRRISHFDIDKNLEEIAGS